MTKIVGITGGIGSGKTTFSNHLKKLGFLVNESDAVVSEIYTKPKKEFLSFIKEKINKNKNILILGFGGASQAIYYGFFLKGYKNVSVFNRSKKAINISGTNNFTKDYSLINPYLINSDLIINTTPINPLNKKQTNLIKKTTIISDIVYKPKETPFLKEFKLNKKIYGISMLVEQALPCFKQWFGFVPAVDESLIKKIHKKIK